MNENMKEKCDLILEAKGTVEQGSPTSGPKLGRCLFGIGLHEWLVRSLPTPRLNQAVTYLELGHKSGWSERICMSSSNLCYWRAGGHSLMRDGLLLVQVELRTYSMAHHLHGTVTLSRQAAKVGDHYCRMKKF